MSKKSYYYNSNKDEDFTFAQPEVVEAAPITEEVSTPVEEPAPESVFVAPAQKNSGEVVLKTKNGCVVKLADGSNKFLYGVSYMEKKIGDIVEF